MRAARASECGQVSHSGIATKMSLHALLLATAGYEALVKDLREKKDRGVGEAALAPVLLFSRMCIARHPLHHRSPPPQPSTLAFTCCVSLEAPG